MAAKKKDAKTDTGVSSAGAAAEHGGDGAEVAEDRVQVVEYAAAIDVAKGFGMVCTRVPGSRPDRRRQKVWRAGATFGEVIALMDHLRCEGIQRLVLESTSDYWRTWYYLAEAAGLEVWLVNARDVKHLPGRGKSDRADCVWLERRYVAAANRAGAEYRASGGGPVKGDCGEDAMRDSIKAQFEVLDERFRSCGGDGWMERRHTGCRWTEGPAYFPAGRYLLFKDIPNDRILRWDEITGAVGVFRHPAGYANGHTIDRHYPR